MGNEMRSTQVDKSVVGTEVGMLSINSRPIDIS